MQQEISTMTQENVKHSSKNGTFMQQTSSAPGEDKLPQALRTARGPARALPLWPLDGHDFVPLPVAVIATAVVKHAQHVTGFMGHRFDIAEQQGEFRHHAVLLKTAHSPAVRHCQKKANEKISAFEKVTVTLPRYHVTSRHGEDLFRGAAQISIRFIPRDIHRIRVDVQPRERRGQVPVFFRVPQNFSLIPPTEVIEVFRHFFAFRHYTTVVQGDTLDQ